MLSIVSTLLVANSLLTAPQTAGPVQNSASAKTPVKASASVQPGAPPKAQNCALRAADKSATLTANDMQDILTSTGTAYSHRTTCNRFVADFIVLSSASPDTQFSDGRFQVGGGLLGFQPVGTSAATCKGLKVDVRVYKKALGSSSFKSYSNVVLEGDWVEANGVGYDTCKLKVKSGALGASAEPNDGGTETYRVAVKTSISGLLAVPVCWTVRYRLVTGLYAKPNVPSVPTLEKLNSGVAAPVEARIAFNAVPH